MLGLNLSVPQLATRGAGGAGVPKAGRLFVAAGDANTLHVQMPSAWRTALSHRMQRGIFTAAASIGAPAQPWRRTDCVEIADVGASAASPIFVFTAATNTGALDYAFQNSAAGFIFGGSFHGGETTSSEQWYADGVAFTPSTTPIQADLFRLERTTLIDWGSGNTMPASYAIAFGPDGSLNETGSFSSSSAFSSQYVGMDIWTPNFGERRNGASIVSTTVDSDVAGDATDITYRAPATGYAVRIVSNIPSATRYQRSFTAAQKTQVKHYPQLASTAGGAFGSASYSRTISFSKGVPNPFYWSGPANSGDGNGWNRVSGWNEASVTWDDTNKQVVFTRSVGSGSSRAAWPLTGLTPGQAYTLSACMAVAGGSPSAGTLLSISATANGAGGVLLGNAANGAPSYSIAGASVTAASMYIIVSQASAAGSDNVLRLNEFKLT